MAPIFPNFSVPPPQLRKRYEADSGAPVIERNITEISEGRAGQCGCCWYLLCGGWVSCPFTFILFECALLLAVSVWE